MLLDAINDKQYSINEKDRNVILTLNFYVIKKKIEIPFNLLEQPIQKENSNKEVYELVYKLTEENKIIREELKNIKNELKELKDEFQLKKLQMKLNFLMIQIS